MQICLIFIRPDSKMFPSISSLLWWIIEVCVPELGTNRDKTGQDWRPFPNCRDWDGTTCLWSRCLGKFGKNSGPDGTTREKSWMVFCLVLVCITYFSTQQEISPNFPEISNSEIPVSFSGLRQDRSWPVPNGGTETGPGRGCSRMLGTGKFPNFPGKIWYPKNETGNADL